MKVIIFSRFSNFIFVLNIMTKCLALSETSGTESDDRCNRTVDIYQTVSSPPVTDSNRGKPLHCTYRIRIRPQRDDWIVFVRFTRMKVGEHSLDRQKCVGGYVQIVDGYRESNHSNKDYSGYYCGEIDTPKTFISETPYVKVVFHSDSYQIDSYIQFDANVEQQNSVNSRYGQFHQLYPHRRGVAVTGTYCEKTYPDCSPGPRCTLQSPGFPGIYGRNLRCRYHLNARQSFVGLELSSFDVDGQDCDNLLMCFPRPVTTNQNECPFDYVRIYDGPDDNSPVIATLCGKGRIKSSIISSTSNMLVEFVTSPAGPLLSTGFHFKADAIIDTGNSESMQLSNGSCVLERELSSESTVGNVFAHIKSWYPPNTSCLYKFKTRDKKGLISLEFLWFRIERVSLCQESVRIFDANDSDMSALITRLCDMNRPQNGNIRTKYVSTGPAMTVQFSSLIGSFDGSSLNYAFELKVIYPENDPDINDLSTTESTSNYSLFSEPKSNGLNGVWDLSYPLNDDSEANAFETSMPSLESHQCKSLLEYGCDNGKCVPLSRYCDGTDDCGDQSDEPIACTNCNRTLYGEVGLKYPFRLNEPFQRFQPFVCRVEFSAAGQQYGDIVELTFLSFQIGQFEVGKKRSADCYSGHVIIEEQNSPVISTSHKSQQKSGSFQLMSTFKENRRQKQKSNSDYRQSGDEEENSSNKKIMVSSTGSPSTPQFGRFCGQMSVRSATYFSEGNNVSLILFVPSRASVVVHSFSLYLTYKFLPSRPAVTRFGPPGDPFELGIKIDNTYCDHIFDDCSANKKCKIRSPNWPGFYNRNISCKYWVRHNAPVPPGYRARIVVSQNNEYKISLYTGSSASSSSSDHLTSTTLQSDCPLDVVRIYDGQTTDSPVLIEFCGSGVLPPIVTSRPEMLVVLSSAANQILFNSRLELNVSIKLEKVHDSDLLGQRIGVCDFVYDGSKIRSGLIETPKHTIPANTSCTYKLVSNNSWDRVWIYFVSYFIQDRHHWSSEELCDVSRLEIHDSVPSQTLNDSLQVHYSHQKQKVYSFCEKTSPKICGRAADANHYLPLNPCTYPSESYLSSGSELTIKHDYYKHFDFYVRRASFAARFEFVDTFQFGQQIDNRICDRLFKSDGNYSKGRLSSPKNLLFYGRGGRESLSCGYYLKGTDRQRLRIVFHAIRIQSLSCEQVFHPLTDQYECRVFNKNTNNRPKVAFLTVSDSQSSQRIQVGCLCNIMIQSLSESQSHTTRSVNDKSTSNSIVFDMISSDVVLNFSVTRMSPFEDFNDYGFEASYEFLPIFDCNSGGLVQRHNGSEGEILYSVPKNYNFKGDGPLKCRWIVEASYGKHLFLKFKGHLANTQSEECLTGNRFVVYAGDPLRSIATVCTSKAKWSVDNDSEEFDLFSSSWYNETDSFDRLAQNDTNGNYSEVRIFVEIVAQEVGAFSMRWLEVTKPFLRTQTGKTMRNINCKVECPEINACISDELVCDGIPHCPSSHDENPKFCNKFPMLYVVSSGLVLIFCVLVILIVTAIYRLNERRRLRIKQSNQSSTHCQYNQNDSDYSEYPEYPRLGSELNFRSLQESHQIQYTQNGMPLEITRSFVPHYHNNVF